VLLFVLVYIVKGLLNLYLLDVVDVPSHIGINSSPLEFKVNIVSTFIEHLELYVIYEIRQDIPRGIECITPSLSAFISSNSN